MSLRLQPVQVAMKSDDTESLLIVADGFLVAILVRLSAQHEDEAGKGFLEAGFGPVSDPRPPVFFDLDMAQDWIEQQLGRAA